MKELIAQYKKQIEIMNERIGALEKSCPPFSDTLTRGRLMTLEIERAGLINSIKVMSEYA